MDEWLVVAVSLGIGFFGCWLSASRPLVIGLLKHRPASLQATELLCAGTCDLDIVE